MKATLKRGGPFLGFHFFRSLFVIISAFLLYCLTRGIPSRSVSGGKDGGSVLIGLSRIFGKNLHLLLDTIKHYLFKKKKNKRPFTENKKPKSKFKKKKIIITVEHSGCLGRISCSFHFFCVYVCSFAF